MFTLDNNGMFVINIIVNEKIRNMSSTENSTQINSLIKQISQKKAKTTWLLDMH